jgi:hypothetical protein
LISLTFDDKFPIIAIAIPFRLRRTSQSCQFSPRRPTSRAFVRFSVTSQSDIQIQSTFSASSSPPSPRLPDSHSSLASASQAEHVNLCISIEFLVVDPSLTCD